LLQQLGFSYFYHGLSTTHPAPFPATRLHTALGYQSPYETKLKEYEQRLAEIDKELLGKTEEVEELVDAETEERRPQRPVRSNVNPRKAKSALQRHGEVGRPALHERAIARAFVAKAVYNKTDLLIQ
jgi:hypothetical protein